jgi:hypothetical protein
LKKTEIYGKQFSHKCIYAFGFFLVPNEEILEAERQRVREEYEQAGQFVLFIIKDV